MVPTWQESQENLGGKRRSPARSHISMSSTTDLGIFSLKPQLVQMNFMVLRIVKKIGLRRNKVYSFKFTIFKISDRG